MCFKVHTGEVRTVIAHLNGDFETVDFLKDKNILLYDNVQDEEYPPHWHNAIEMIMPLESTYTVICSGKEHILNERDIMLIPAGKIHNLKAKRGRRLILLCDSKLIEGAEQLAELRPVIAEPLVVNESFGADLLRSLGNIMKEIYTLYFEPGALSDIYVFMKILVLLTHIREYQLNRIRPEDSEKYSETVHRILAYIEKNYMNDISLEGLAGIAGYSTYHFSRIFRKYSGTTFINYLNNRRVSAAELLLLEDNASVTEAASRVGFSSLTTFNRVFKEINGCTPSEFKKLYRTAKLT